MRELGYVEKQSLTVEDRWAEGRSEHFHGLIADLIRLKVDVLVPLSTQGGLAANALTTTIPIVFVATDPVGTGLVSSLDRLGGNLTRAHEGGPTASTPAVPANGIVTLRPMGT